MATKEKKKKVHKVMHEHKHGSLEEQLGKEGQEPQTGDRNSDVGKRSVTKA
jgi:hypothetical protein